MLSIMVEKALEGSSWYMVIPHQYLSRKQFHQKMNYRLSILYERKGYPGIKENPELAYPSETIASLLGDLTSSRSLLS
jgi:hypothetical protein